MSVKHKVPILVIVFPATDKSIYCDANKPCEVNMDAQLLTSLECGEDNMQAKLFSALE